MTARKSTAFGSLVYPEKLISFDIDNIIIICKNVCSSLSLCAFSFFKPEIPNVSVPFTVNDINFVQVSEPKLANVTEPTSVAEPNIISSNSGKGKQLKKKSKSSAPEKKKEEEAFRGD